MYQVSFRLTIIYIYMGGGGTEGIYTKMLIVVGSGTLEYFHGICLYVCLANMNNILTVISY